MWAEGSVGSENFARQKRERKKGKECEPGFLAEQGKGGRRLKTHPIGGGRLRRDAGSQKESVFITKKEEETTHIQHRGVSHALLKKRECRRRYEVAAPEKGKRNM